MAQKPQLVGYAALAFAQQPGRLLLTHVEAVKQAPDSLGLLNEVQILPLQILHQRRHARFQIVHAHQYAGNIRDPGQLGSPQPALPGDQLVDVIPPPDGQRLQDAVLPDGLRQLVQRPGGEDLPGLGRVGLDGLGRQENHPSGFHVGFQLLALHYAVLLVRLMAPF